MKCAYTSGILDRMLDDGIKPDYVIGVSAGAACGASFVAGQRDRNRRFFVDYVERPDYMGWTAFYRSKGNFFNLEYIYQDILQYLRTEDTKSTLQELCMEEVP